MTSAKKNVPDQEQIDHWLKVNRDSLNVTAQDWANGYYVEKNISPQSVFSSDAMTYASLGRAQFLNGDPLKEVRDSYRKAGAAILRGFKIVYDPNDEFYEPEPKTLRAAHEAEFMEGAFYALIANDYSLAKELATIFQTHPKGPLMDPEVCDFCFGLKYTLLDEDQQALAILKPRLEKYLKKPPKGGYKRNYHTLTTALMGILQKDDEPFNEGLAMQLKFYKGQIPSEYKNTDEEFICDKAVALANLGLHRGLNLTIENDLIPPGLLIEKAP